MTILSGKYQFYYHCYFKGKETEAQRSKLLKIMWDKMCEHLDFTDSILSFFGYAVSRKKFLKLKTWAGGPQEEARLHLLPDSPPQAHHFNSCLNPLSCPFWPFVACGQAPRRTDRLLFAHWRLAACGRDPLRRWLRRTPWDSGWSGGPRGQGGAVDRRPPEPSPRSPAGWGPGLEAAATLSPSSPLGPDGSGTAWAAVRGSRSPLLWEAWGAWGPVELGTWLLQWRQLGRVWEPGLEEAANWICPLLTPGWRPWRVKVMFWHLSLSCQDGE